MSVSKKSNRHNGRKVNPIDMMWVRACPYMNFGLEVLKFRSCAKSVRKSFKSKNPKVRPHCFSSFRSRSFQVTCFQVTKTRRDDDLLCVKSLKSAFHCMVHADLFYASVRVSRPPEDQQLLTTMMETKWRRIVRFGHGEYPLEYEYDVKNKYY